MILQRINLASTLFRTENKGEIKLINFLVEILKRNNIGSKEEKQCISYKEENLEILKKIGDFMLFFYRNECPNFRTLKETEKLVENLLECIKEKKPLLIYAMFCPSYKKSKEIFGFNVEIGETTKKGINNLDTISKQISSLGIVSEVYAIYSDLVIENFDKLDKSDFDNLEENFSNFVKYAQSINPKIKLMKISQIGNCKLSIGTEGKATQKSIISDKKIESISNRSKPFYRDILGWSDEKIRSRTKVLANNCAVMGAEMSNINPRQIMVMTENIYERGIFYYSSNLEKPLPIFYPRKKENKIEWIKIK